MTPLALAAVSESGSIAISLRYLRRGHTYAKPPQISLDKPQLLYFSSVLLVRDEPEGRMRNIPPQGEEILWI
jgi:hypothetical protein